MGVVLGLLVASLVLISLLTGGVMCLRAPTSSPSGRGVPCLKKIENPIDIG